MRFDFLPSDRLAARPLQNENVGTLAQQRTREIKGRTCPLSREEPTYATFVHLVRVWTQLGRSPAKAHAT
jgi:hypothetical protein